MVFSSSIRAVIMTHWGQGHLLSRDAAAIPFCTGCWCLHPFRGFLLQGFLLQHSQGWDPTCIYLWTELWMLISSTIESTFINTRLWRQTRSLFTGSSLWSLRMSHGHLILPCFCGIDGDTEVISRGSAFYKVYVKISHKVAEGWRNMSNMRQLNADYCTNATWADRRPLLAHHSSCVLQPPSAGLLTRSDLLWHPHNPSRWSLWVLLL